MEGGDSERLGGSIDLGEEKLADPPVMQPGIPISYGVYRAQFIKDKIIRCDLVRAQRTSPSSAFDGQVTLT